MTFMTYRVDSDHAAGFVRLGWSIIGATPYALDRWSVTVEAPNMRPMFPCLEEGCTAELDEYLFTCMGGKCSAHAEGLL